MKELIRLEDAASSERYNTQEILFFLLIPDTSRVSNAVTVRNKEEILTHNGKMRKRQALRSDETIHKN